MKAPTTTTTTTRGFSRTAGWWWGAALALAGVLGCTAPKDTGSAQINVRSTNQALITDIDSVEVTITGAGISPPIVELLPGDPISGWSGMINDIPVGTDRTFAGAAYDGTTAIYAGEASPVNILPDDMALVTLFLVDLAPPPPYFNSAPRITGLTVSAYELLPGETATLTVTAIDPDGDPLTYLWSGSAGTWGTPTAATTTWTAPMTAGTVPLHVAVSDPSGTAATLDITMAVGSGMGSAFVNIDINTSPEVLSMVPAPTQIEVGDNSYVDLTATDPDGDLLSYSWTASCMGSYDDVTIEDPAFTLDELPSPNECDLTVTITDGKGGVNSGTVNMPVGPDICGGTPCGPTTVTPGELIWSYQGHGLSGQTAVAMALQDDGRIVTAALDESDVFQQIRVERINAAGAYELWEGVSTTADEVPMSVAATAGLAIVGGTSDGTSSLMRAYRLGHGIVDWEITYPGQGVYAMVVVDGKLWTLDLLATGTTRLSRFDPLTGANEFGAGLGVVGAPPEGGLAVDLAGNFVICTTVGTPPSRNYWLAKYSPAGTPLWTTTYDSGWDEICKDVAVSGTGDIYAVGQRIVLGDGDFAIARFDSTGTLISDQNIHVGANEAFESVAVAPNGHVFAVGFGDSTGVVVQAYFPTLVPRWQANIGGSGAAALAIADDGGVLALGTSMYRTQLTKIAP